MNEATKPRANWAIWLPLALFAALVGLVAVGLHKGPDTTIASQLVGKPLPKFDLAPAVDGMAGLSDTQLRNGQVHLVNVFASWCVPCAAEAPQLGELARRGVNVVGIAIRDQPQDLSRFLAHNGNPFQRIGGDPISAVQLSLGSSGVPESFVVDGRGVIRYQHIGDIRPEQVDMIVQKIADAGAGG